MNIRDDAQSIIDILDVKKFPLKAYICYKYPRYSPICRNCRTKITETILSINEVKGVEYISRCFYCDKLLRFTIGIYPSYFNSIFSQLRNIKNINEKRYICTQLAKMFLDKEIHYYSQFIIDDCIKRLYKYVFTEIITNFPSELII